MKCPKCQSKHYIYYPLLEKYLCLLCDKDEIISHAKEVTDGNK